MMWLATVTSKGQLAIPKDVRERLGLRKQDKVLFTIVDGKALMTPLPRPSAASLAGCLRSEVPFAGADAVRWSPAASGVSIRSTVTSVASKGCSISSPDTLRSYRDE